MTWHAERFDENAGRDRVRFDCTVCARPMWFPRTKVGKYKTCGEECSQAARDAYAASKVRRCVVCDSPFSPRPVQVRRGGGKYCSIRCSITVAFQHARTPEVFAKIRASLKAAYDSRRIVRLKGPAHPQWTGGKKASRSRRRVGDTIRAREWRRANPELARDAVRKRRGKIRLNRLPRGTTARIGAAQRWKCAVCRIDIRRKYHIDHVMPLVLGGQHVPLNLQLLCPPCNLHKNGKDPIRFMQERGFLL